MGVSREADSEFNDLVNACMTRANAKKTDWGIEDDEIALVTPLLTIWNTKYSATLNKKMTTTSDREAKNLARNNLEPVFSNFIEKNIYLNSLMNDADIASCDLEPHKTTRTKSGKPTTIPQMEYRAGQAHTLKGFYRQSPGEDGSSKRGKPKGVSRCEIAYMIIEKKPETPNPEDEGGSSGDKDETNPLLMNPDDFPKRSSGRKSPVLIQFPPSDAGKYVVLASRWMGLTDIPGDWGLVEFMMIP